MANTHKPHHAYAHVSVEGNHSTCREGDFQACSGVTGDGQSLSPPVSSKLKFPRFENSVPDPFVLFSTDRRANILWFADLAQKSCLIFAVCYILPLNRFPKTGN